VGPELLIPLALSAGGTALQYFAQENANRERQDAINAMMRQRDQATQQVIGDVQEEAKRYTQPNLQAETAEVQRASEDRLMNDLKTALSPSQREVPVGKVSGEYLARKAEREATEKERGANLARLFAAIDAPNQTRIKQSLDAADARARRGAIMAGSQDYANRVGVELEKIQPNPALTTVGGLAIGAGQGVSTMTANEQIRKILEGQAKSPIPAQPFYYP
jgi:hypothetical protein